jgi:hypothetical protein
MLRHLSLGVALLFCLGLGFIATLYLLSERVERPNSEERLAPVQTRCELTFPVRACPAQPNFSGINQRNVYHDDFEGSGSDERRCLARAREFYVWCKFDFPVTARFYRGEREVATDRWPK